MNRLITVLLGEGRRLVGTLRYNQDGRRETAAFEYHADWLTAQDRFAIDSSLPLVSGPQFHKKTPNGSVFHAAIADTEPDGWARRVMLRDHAKRRAGARQRGEELASTLGALDFLLGADDMSRVGALRFADETGTCQRAPVAGRRTAPPLVELKHLLSAARAVETNTESAADLDYLRGRGTSLGGLRPKCSVIDDAGNLSVGKFPSVNDERAVTKGEVLAMQLAATAGIAVATAALIDSDGVPVALIRRFDRSGPGRIMYVSAATMLGAQADDPVEHSYTELADALRQSGASSRADIEELWRRIAFSVLITNVDDHLHNHGFLQADKDKWRLAPAFDLNPFPDRERELKTWISEDTGPQATVDALMEAAPYFQLASDRARTILGEVEAAVARWRDCGEALGMTNDELEQFADAFEHSERRAARAAARAR